MLTYLCPSMLLHSNTPSPSYCFSRRTPVYTGTTWSAAPHTTGRSAAALADVYLLLQAHGGCTPMVLLQTSLSCWYFIQNRCTGNSMHAQVRLQSGAVVYHHSTVHGVNSGFPCCAFCCSNTKHVYLLGTLQWCELQYRLQRVRRQTILGVHVFFVQDYVKGVPPPVAAMFVLLKLGVWGVLQDLRSILLPIHAFVQTCGPHAAPCKSVVVRVCRLRHVYALFCCV
jgi:hypothetical protein